MQLLFDSDIIIIGDKTLSLLIKYTRNYILSANLFVFELLVTEENYYHDVIQLLIDSVLS